LIFCALRHLNICNLTVDQTAQDRTMAASFRGTQRRTTYLGKRRHMSLLS